ncbi:hypothetical protein LC065_20245 (plasmid) [Halobacillus litoralis]|uniref:hypothetical protein n=1 Tax=Halobacillus litoralis TaxID=45668 RepID=UPI001CFEEFA1|nr:hypothetical protein [Halobacillus litoralis]WLR49577.1 hypothetical protein LC065_20245 [Halobacillus litoralis]
MEIKKGFKYTIVADCDINIFATGILTLTNFKNTHGAVVKDFRTFMGTDMVSVVTSIEFGDELLRMFGGRIKAQYEVNIAEIDQNDLSDEAIDQINALENELDFGETDYKLIFKED